MATRKEQVQAELARELDVFESMRTECHNIQIDLDLSDTGKAKRIAKVRESQGARFADRLRYAAAPVSTRMHELQNARKADAEKCDNATHQLRLANVVKALEASGGKMSRQEVEALVEPVKHDANAKWTVCAALESVGVKGFAGVWKEELFIHHAQRNRNIKELEELDGMIRGMWEKIRAFENLDDLGIQLVIANVNSKLSHFDDELNTVH